MEFYAFSSKETVLVSKHYIVFTLHTHTLNRKGVTTGYFEAKFTTGTRGTELMAIQKKYHLSSAESLALKLIDVEENRGKAYMVILDNLALASKYANMTKLHGRQYA